MEWDHKLIILVLSIKLVKWVMEIVVLHLNGYCFISILQLRKLFRKCTKNSVIDFLDIHKIQYYASFNKALDN